MRSECSATEPPPQPSPSKGEGVGAFPPSPFQGEGEGGGSVRNEEFDDLVVLLLDHAVRSSVETALLARLVAHACLGENHLWQDLGLPHRQALNDLMREHFPALHAKNSGNMRWKKFFYRQLCERAEVLICKSPSCGVCCDYATCFGPEEGPARVHGAETVHAA